MPSKAVSPAAYTERNLRSEVNIANTVERASLKTYQRKKKNATNPNSKTMRRYPNPLTVDVVKNCRGGAALFKIVVVYSSRKGWLLIPKPFFQMSCAREATVTKKLLYKGRLCQISKILPMAELVTAGVRNTTKNRYLGLQTVSKRRSSMEYPIKPAFEPVAKIVRKDKMSKRMLYIIRRALAFCESAAVIAKGKNKTRISAKLSELLKVARTWTKAE